MSDDRRVIRADRILEACRSLTRERLAHELIPDPVAMCEAWDEVHGSIQDALVEAGVIDPDAEEGT